MSIRINWGEKELARKVKAVGGIWDRDKQVWTIRYDQVKELQLEERMVKEEESIYI